MPTQIGSRQLRSSSAHCARKLAKRLAKSWQGGSGRGSGGRGGGGEGGGAAGTAVIKSNNPHLVGGDYVQYIICVLLSIPESMQTRGVSQHVCTVSMHFCSRTPTPWLTTGKTALGGSAAPAVRPGGARPTIEQEPLAEICWDGHGQVVDGRATQNKCSTADATCPLDWFLLE